MIHLNESARKELLKLARGSLDSYFATGKVGDTRPDRPELHQLAGAFVSLHRGDELRGCIGLIEPEGPLYRTVQRCAVSAAVEDFRFDPVTADELPEIKIEISVLSALKVADNISEIKVGKHGLYMVRGHRRGLLLPQVATDYGWDRESFLTQTCHKAGLSGDAWRDPATAIYLFEAQVFSE
ncbi:MAG: AmmeMemoRadiSam system protein A [Acidobacteria bacterium]|nr:AmmeMemoRadiSam system protein A [Acidobacteriota bacterium]